MHVHKRVAIPFNHIIFSHYESLDKKNVPRIRFTTKIIIVAYKQYLIKYNLLSDLQKTDVVLYDKKPHCRAGQQILLITRPDGADLMEAG